MKFGKPSGIENVSFDYGKKFYGHTAGSSARVTIGASSDQINLLKELSESFHGEPWYVLYVLLISRRGTHEPGRYQSEAFWDHIKLAAFLDDFRLYFEGDGRHHLWIGSGSNNGLLVYDQHNVVIAYGPIDAYREVLKRRGYIEESFRYPIPHVHCYNAEFDDDEDRLLASQSWNYSPLRPGDEQ